MRLHVCVMWCIVRESMCAWVVFSYVQMYCYKFCMHVHIKYYELLWLYRVYVVCICVSVFMHVQTIACELLCEFACRRASLFSCSWKYVRACVVLFVYVNRHEICVYSCSCAHILLTVCAWAYVCVLVCVHVNLCMCLHAHAYINDTIWYIMFVWPT